MKRLLALLSAVALVPACASLGTRSGEGSEIVALVVRTEPGGAKVRIDRIEREWTTPCDIADPAIRRGRLDVTVLLEGHESVTRRVLWDGEIPARLELSLVAKTGTVAVVNAPPGALVMLLRAPAGAVGLWSENEETVRSTLESLSAADATAAQSRVRELLSSPSPAVAEAAKKKDQGVVGTAAFGIGVTHRVTADASGSARLTYVPSAASVHLLVTRAGSPDFVSPDVKPHLQGTLAIPVPPPPKPVEAAPAATLAKLTVKAAGDRVRVTAGEKVVADVPTKAGESVKLTVPREKVLVEFMDAKSGAVTGSVELVPEAEAPPAPAAGDADRLGKIQLVHPKFGIFVRLEPGQELAIGDFVLVLRDGREVARARVLRVCAGDSNYPAGAAMLSPEAAVARKGDDARRAKP